MNFKCFINKTGKVLCAFGFSPVTPAGLLGLFVSTRSTDWIWIETCFKAPNFKSCYRFFIGFMSGLCLGHYKYIFLLKSDYWGYSFHRSSNTQAKQMGDPIKAGSGL